MTLRRCTDCASTLIGGPDSRCLSCGRRAQRASTQKSRTRYPVIEGLIRIGVALLLIVLLAVAFAVVMAMLISILEAATDLLYALAMAPTPSAARC